MGCFSFVEEEFWGVITALGCEVCGMRWGVDRRLN